MIEESKNTKKLCLHFFSFTFLYDKNNFEMDNAFWTQSNLRPKISTYFN